MMPANRFAYNLCYLAHRILHLRAVAAEIARRNRDCLTNDRRYEKKREAQLPIHIEQCSKQTDNGKSFAQNHGNRVGHRARYLIHIISYFRY